MPSSSRTSSLPAATRSVPGAQVVEELQAIDTSLLDKLIEIRTEQTRLELYRHKAAELKDTVKDAVWKRVIEDYAARSKQLEEQAAPLKGDVQREYRKLRALHDRISAIHEETRLAKEELEFREAVGELSKEDLKARLDAPQRTLDGCRRDLAAVEAQKAKFVEAFGSEADLETAAVPSAEPASHLTHPGPEAVPLSDRPAEPIAPSPTPRSDTANGDSVAAELMAPSEPVGVPAAVQGEAATFNPDLTRLASPSASIAEEVADAPRTDLTRIVSRGTNRPAPDDRTMLLPRAALLVTLGDGQPLEQRLGAINYMGRTEDNQIQINRPGVSRRHAVIQLAPTGFVVKDLGSQNGTFLNGERVAEKRLVDGDRIVIGDAQIVFRLQ
jgi:FHA domain